jgi:hypothetical protein
VTLGCTQNEHVNTDLEKAMKFGHQHRHSRDAATDHFEKNKVVQTLKENEH